MGWNAGNFFVAPGSTIQIQFKWGSGDDKGPQWAMAHPVAGEPESALLVTERVGKKHVCVLGRLVINGPGQYSCAGTDSNYEYRVWIKNDGSDGCRFELEGGGV